jgi:hypothetical protein
LPSLAAILQDKPDDQLGTRKVLEDAYRFSRMLHGIAAATRSKEFAEGRGKCQK